MCQRVLSSDDPEPAVGSVVLFDGKAYQRLRYGVTLWKSADGCAYVWADFMRDDRPTLLLWDGGAK